VKITHGSTTGRVTRSAIVEDGPVIHRAPRGALPGYRVKIEEVIIQYDPALDDLNRLIWVAREQVNASGRILAADCTLTSRAWSGPVDSPVWVAKIARWLTPGPFPLRSNAALYVRTDGESS